MNCNTETFKVTLDEIFSSDIDGNREDKIGNLFIQLQDHERAIIHFIKGAEMEDVNCIFHLGQLYLERDMLVLAEEQLLILEEMGESRAMRLLGVLYEKRMDFGLARKMYIRAADEKDELAQLHLSRLSEKLQSMNTVNTMEFMDCT